MFIQYCQLAQNQPKSHILFHKNGSLRDFYIMTFTGRKKKYDEVLLEQTWNRPGMIKTHRFAM